MRRTSTSAVLPAVRSSTCLITRAGQPATTVRGGTSSITTAPAATTAPSPTRQPSSTTQLAPIITSSSTTTGVAEAGSTTPASTVPAPIWQWAPTVARPPSTAPMSIMVPGPTIAPMLRMAPIMITALSPISTRSRIIAPGSMRALMPEMSSRGTPELRRSHSTTASSTASPAASSAAASGACSAKTTIPSGPPKTCAPSGQSTVAPGARRTYALAGVFLGAVAM